MTARTGVRDPSLALRAGEDSIGVSPLPQAERPPLALLEGVTRSFRGRRGERGFHLQPTTLAVHAGTWSVISGRSGSGKTTLLHLLAGLERPDEGTVWLFGEEVSGYTERALADVRRRRLGIIYQRFFFLDQLPVWQNVSCRLVVSGWPARERRRRAEAMLEQFGLSGMADRLPRELSGGEQQRVALARAVVGDPELIVADEPTSNVDAETGALMIAHLKRLQAKGAAVVVATHDSALVEGADVAYVMRDGGLGPA